MELTKLSDRDYSLIITKYGFESYFEPRGTGELSFSSPSAARKAYYRARIRLSKALERRLVDSLSQSPPEDRQCLEDALAIILGENYIEALEVITEICDEPDEIEPSE